MMLICFFFFFQAEDGIRDLYVTGVQTCALPIYGHRHLPVRSDAEQAVRPGMEDGAHVVEADAGVGDVERPRRRRSDVVEKYGPQRGQTHAVERRAGLGVEG